MGMMAKMRSLAPWFIITVGGLFVLFMVLSDSQLVNIVGQRSNNIGYVNGEPITYQQFTNYFETVRRQQQAQTGEDIDETQLEALRDQVWSAVVNQLLIDEKVDEFGIIVTDEEVKDAILGPNPPAFLRQSFIDSNGVFNRQAYEQALFDPRNAEILIQAEETVRAQLVQDKLKSYLMGSVVVNDGEIKRKFVEQNTVMTAEYGLIDYTLIPDTLASVADSDLLEYYNKNKSDYKVDPQRKIKYVFFERKASLDDSVSIRKNLEAIIKNIESDTASFRSFVNIYSEQPYSKDTLTVDKIHPNAVEILKEASIGEIIGPVLTMDGFTVYKLINKSKGELEFARASHILISGTEDAAKQKADSVYQSLMSGANFEQTAIEISEDPGSGSRGGELGWFGKGQMVDEFENAVFTGRVGVIQRPVMSQFGYHIIKVTDRTNEKYVVEKIVNKILASGTTLDRIYENATDFSYLARENNFDSEAELLGYNVVETPNFSENATFIPGLGASKALVKFAFENKVGSISDVYRVPSGYVVAKISEATKAGFKPFDELKQQLQVTVLRQKKIDKAKEFAEHVYEQVLKEGSLFNVTLYSPFARFDIAKEFTPKSNIPTVGRDNAFVAYCLKGELNEISKPIVGNRGAYLIKITDRTEFDQQAYEQQKNTLRESMLQQKRSQFFTEWIAKVRDEADIVDNRHIFYR